MVDTCPVPDYPPLRTFRLRKDLDLSWRKDPRLPIPPPILPSIVEEFEDGLYASYDNYPDTEFYEDVAELEYWLQTDFDETYELEEEQ